MSRLVLAARMTTLVTALGLLVPALATAVVGNGKDRMTRDPLRPIEEVYDDACEAVDRVLRPDQYVPTPSISCMGGYTGGISAFHVIIDDDIPPPVHPGLIATYRDTARPTPHEVLRRDPTIALSLKAGEAPHPALAADGGTIRWEGRINLLQAGEYRFRVRLRGKFRLTIGGKEVLVAESKDAAPVWKEGPAVQLDEGVQPLVAEFTRLPGAACVELVWQGPGFRAEPLPHDVLSHEPKQELAGLAAAELREVGRFLVEERNCTACHRAEDSDRMAKGLHPRQGPDLSQIGGRAHPGWVYHWLAAPKKVEPHAVMPQLFSDEEAGRTERYAVARYLTTLGGPMPRAKGINPKEMAASASRGQRLFNSIGCVACHRTEDAKAEDGAAHGLLAPGGVRATYPLPALGSKTTPDKLAAYLLNPLAVDPGGRMPSLLLSGDEARDLARFLCQTKDAAIRDALPDAPSTEQMLAAFKRVDPRAEELAAFQKLPADKQWADLGKRLVIDKGCNNCHTLAPGGKPFANSLARATFDDIKKPEKQTAGCLAEPAKSGQAPRFGWTEAERKAVRAFLRDGTRGAGSPAPAHAARTLLKRFNCLACHSRDGEGGLTAELTEELRKYEKAENAEAVVPPPLTGVGHKLRTPWLREVLTNKGRARPWMGLRMPQFGPANIGPLPEALAVLEGAEPDDAIHKVPLTPARIEAGRQLVGKSAFGCITCHDIAGVPNHGTRGPDLATVNQRVRHEWYRRWLEQPQRMQPGTRMPTIFSNGKTLLDKVLDGSADAQADAMWAYLSLGPGLPLPEGLEVNVKGRVVAVKDRPVLLRTFLPDAGSRAVAVGYPGGLSMAFDAQRCRLSYAWSGPFLDASPVWDGRGGAPATLLGPRFWAAPPGCPWSVSPSSDPPDFDARAKDPAFGGPLPEGKRFTGTPQLRFEGYTVNGEGRPTFRYLLNAGEAHPAEIHERPEPLKAPAAVGVARHFTVQVPAQQTAWLLAGETGREPRLLDAKGEAVAVDLQAGAAEVPVAARLLVLPQDGNRVVALPLTGIPPGAQWHLRRQGGKWQALLRQAPSKEAARVNVEVRAWVPYRDEPALLKDLLPRR